MKDITNTTAGMADPYWYEWTVGLFYALDMLIPDNNIKHVVFQTRKLQGLDDVIIHYNNDEADCIQIKHTRENTSLTFTDMIQKSDESDSYVRHFCSDWKRAQKIGFKSCKPVLFTNRNIGSRKYTANDSNGGQYERPPLEKFWSHVRNELQGAVYISDINMRKEWETSWELWLSEMDVLNDQEKLSFLKSFEIKANQEDLNQIIDSVALKISKYFKVSSRVAVQLHKSLCYALMTWATSLRKREEVTKEDLLEALSLNSDNLQGVHDIPTKEPFFSSRYTFADELEEIIRNRQSPVVFLSGEPGAGKTNIVSHLANKVDSVITIRFHTFKPLSAEDLYLPADKGVSDPKALWGDLLIELREILRGRLSKYCVPISNELLPTVEELRSEVLRLSKALAIESGVTTVIAIDGIDHAARAGDKVTFLSTLVPPEGVPEKVCFLIAGQPVHEYNQYPDWLADKDKVLEVSVPRINEQDIKQLYFDAGINISREYSDIAIKLINDAAAGNTLSALFAIYEAKLCSTIEELDEQLRNKELSSGITAYYEYIWKSAIENLPGEFFYVDTILAGVFSLLNKKVDPKIMLDICGDIGITEMAWKRVMQKLYPVVVNIEGFFGVFHNDVRIYLEKYIKKDVSTFIDVAGRIADYLILKSDDAFSRHELVFQLLKYSKRENDYVNVFTKEYVVEALSIARPMDEIIEQLKLTLKSNGIISNMNKVVSLSCAVATLHQFQQSLQWSDKQYQAKVDLPSALFSEKKVVHKPLLTVDKLRGMFTDVQLLINHDELDRANNVLLRWLADFTPEDVFELLIHNHQMTNETLEKEIIKDINFALEWWGTICQQTMIIGFENIHNNKDDSEKIKQPRAIFARGWLNEGREYTDNDSVMNTLENLSYYFKEDLELFLTTLIDVNNTEMVLKITKDFTIDDFSKILKIKLVVWAILNNLTETYTNLMAEVVIEHFNYIKDVNFRFERDSFPHHILIAFILSYNDEDIDEITDNCLSIYRQGKLTGEDRDYWAARSFLNASYYLGYMYKCLNDANLSRILPEDFEKLIEVLLDEQNIYGRYDVGGHEIEASLLNKLILATNKLDESYAKILQKQFMNRAQRYDNIRHLDIYWSYLIKRNELQVLKDLFDHWMCEDGLVWQQELSELNEIAEEFIEKAIELGWSEPAKKAQEILNRKLIGYVGRKDYSLYTPLKWYQLINSYKNSYWDTLGIQLLNVSQNASDTGDNRAGAAIDSSIAISAGRNGVKSLWEFANVSDNWDQQWIQIIFDGVIGALESNDFSEPELLSIWEVATENFYVLEHPSEYDSNNKLSTVYITDIKEALLLASNRLGYRNLMEEMKKISEFQFGLKRISKDKHSFIIPTRWFDKDFPFEQIQEFLDKIKDLSDDQICSYLKELHASNTDSFRWDYIVSFIRKLKESQSADIPRYTVDMYELLMERGNSYNWEFDGADRAFEEIFPLLNNEMIENVYNNLISAHINGRLIGEDSKIYSINSDLENFSYCYFQTLTEREVVDAFSEILSMHTSWLTGNGILPLRINYEKKKVSGVTDWVDFCNKLNRKYIYC